MRWDSLFWTKTVATGLQLLRNSKLTKEVWNITKKKPPGWWVISSADRGHWFNSQTTAQQQQQQTSLRVLLQVVYKRPEKGFKKKNYLYKKFFSPFLLQSNLLVSNKSESREREREIERNHNDRSTVSSENSPSSLILFLKILFYLLLLFSLLGSPSSVDWQNPPVVSSSVGWLLFFFYIPFVSWVRAQI